MITSFVTSDLYEWRMHESRPVTSCSDRGWVPGLRQSVPAPAATQFAGPVRSPEVSTDRRVTFRLRAPNAKEVTVTGGIGRLAMQKNEQGVWSVTTEPLTPEIYEYSFSVDGAVFPDPRNPARRTAYKASAAAASCACPAR